MRVAVIFVSELSGSVQEAAFSEVASLWARTGRRLLGLSGTGERVELGVAVVRESGGRARVVAARS